MNKQSLLVLTIPLLTLISCANTSLPTAVNNGSAVQDAQPRSSADAGDQTMSSQETQILKELNAARAQGRQCGSTFMPAAPAVSWNGYLAAAARAHALDMATRNFFDHVNPDGVGIKGRAETAGYTGWNELGENIAAGYSQNTVTQGWLDSVGHCKTLMDPALKEVGVGYVYRPGSTYGTYWVQDFGTR